MDLQVIKHDLLKKLYQMEDAFDISDIEDCQNFIMLLSKVIEDKDNIDENIYYAILKIFEKGKKDYSNILKQELEHLKNINNNCDCYCKKDDNRKDLEYRSHSWTFQTVFSYRIFEMINTDYNFNKI